MTEFQIEAQAEIEGINQKLLFLQPLRKTNYQEIDELVVERYFLQKKLLEIPNKPRN
jgi:hypothetical protein